MPLLLLHGPLNSGRAGLIRERFLAALGRDPVLVVPTLDDVFMAHTGTTIRESVPPGST